MVGRGQRRRLRLRLWVAVSLVRWGETDCNTLYPESLLVNLVNYPGLRWHKVEAARLHSCMIGLRVSTGRPSRTPGAGGGGGRGDGT